METRRVVVLVATRKGAWLYHGDGTRKTWRVDGPHFLGQIINHLVLDPRDGRTLLAAAKTGHLGPTIFRSTTSAAPGRRRRGRRPSPRSGGGNGRAVDHSFWLTPGHASEPDVWYAGTSPQGLFRSEDGGDTWEPFSAINDDPQYRAWMGTVQDGTPDGPKLHSIIVDPRDPAHLYFAMSGGGVHESLDGGHTFAPLMKGLEVVEGFDVSDPTFHDPHCVRLCPSNPDRLYQQNHCGIYRLDRPGDRVGAHRQADAQEGRRHRLPAGRAPARCRHRLGLPDGRQQTVWPRTSPDGKPAVYVTRNGGKSWRRLDAGPAREQAWWTVKRQAMTADRARPGRPLLRHHQRRAVDEPRRRRRWACIARHLPEIYAVEARSRRSASRR